MGGERSLARDVSLRRAEVRALWADREACQESEWVVVSPRRWRRRRGISIFAFLETLRIWFDWSGFRGSARIMRARARLRRSASLWWESLIPEYYEGEGDGTGDGDNREVFMLYFIVSEIFLFAAFFWGFVRRAVNPTIDTACRFPPKGTFGPELLWLPITNSRVLLTSGGRSTLALERRKGMNPQEGRSWWINWILWAVLLAALFLWAQWSEYRCLWVTAREGVYGSAFFLATGFHGLHVTLGGLYLLYWSQRTHAWNAATWGVRQTGFTLTVWYWHFVDIVWLILFRVFYYWAGLVDQWSKPTTEGGNPKIPTKKNRTIEDRGRGRADEWAPASPWPPSWASIQEVKETRL